MNLMRIGSRVSHEFGGGMGTTTKAGKKQGKLFYFVIWDDHFRDTWFDSDVLVEEVQEVKKAKG